MVKRKTRIRQTDRQTERQMDRQLDRQSDRQDGRYTDIILGTILNMLNFRCVCC